MSLTGGVNPGVNDVLAAAYAEAGQFPEAIATAEQARQLALAQGSDVMAADMQKKLELYRRGKPWRDTGATNTPPATGLP
jgi:hypothetical protein